jgi:hypothetical protein
MAKRQHTKQDTTSQGEEHRAHFLAQPWRLRMLVREVIPKETLIKL